jgi:HTH-type transcriptional regulator, glycine betaine synthesis regulator
MIVAAAQTELVKDRVDAHRAAPLSALEKEVIDLFVQVSRLLGQPQSLAEIYGLLFISARPLDMDELIARLDMSKGGASQGLKYLCGLGAVKTVYVPGKRRMHFEAVAELRNLATRFVREQLLMHLDMGLDRLTRIGDKVRSLPPGERAQINARIKMLRSWGRRSRRFLQIMARALGASARWP